MRVKHKLPWVPGCVAIAAASSASALAYAYRYPAPASFAHDVPAEVIEAESQHEIFLAPEQVSAVCFRTLVSTFPQMFDCSEVRGYHQLQCL